MTIIASEPNDYGQKKMLKIIWLQPPPSLMITDKDNANYNVTITISEPNDCR